MNRHEELCKKYNLMTNEELIKLLKKQIESREELEKWLKNQQKKSLN